MLRNRNRLVVSLAIAAALASSGILGTAVATADEQVVAGICCTMK